MELAESIETINRQLENLFGKDAVTNDPIWRVVGSEDQFEKRQTDVTPEGLQLLSPIVSLLPKYRQWIKERYVLERLVLVPDADQKELLGLKVSYEPIWIFETQQGVYLPPRIDAAKLVIDTIYAAQGKKSIRKYVDEEAKNPIEYRQQRINNLQAELFGEDTVGPLEHGGGVFIAAQETVIKDNAASPKQETEK